jgi:hypothetical protein
MTDVTVYASGSSAYTIGVLNDAGSVPIMSYMIINASGSGSSFFYAILNKNGSQAFIGDTVARATNSSGGLATAFSNEHSAGSAELNRSSFIGRTAIWNDSPPPHTVKISSSMIDGYILSGYDFPPWCVFCFNQDYAPLNDVCQ